MDTNKMELMRALRHDMTEVTKQIDAVKADVEKQIAVLPYPDNVTVYDYKDRNGRHVLTDLLCARAELLAAMVRLQTAK